MCRNVVSGLDTAGHPISSAAVMKKGKDFLEFATAMNVSAEAH